MKESSSEPQSFCPEDNCCPTFLISDEPQSNDQDGEAHDKVAEGIFNLVLDEDGGKSIGLEGDYGTGKTTVIKILEDKLTNPSENLETDKKKKAANCKLIIFDAWVHEGDPLRRAFLENTINKLMDFKNDDKPWIDNDEWKDKLLVIAQKKEIKTTKTIPHLTPLGKWVAGSILLIPIGLAFINAALRNDNLVIGSGSISFAFLVRFIIGIILASSPAILIGIQATRLWKQSKKNKRETEEGLKSGNSSKLQDETDSIFALLFNRAITEDRTETSKTPNPTALEFEIYFKDLMAQALKSPDRRLVFVFDNLDRVEAHIALSIWSTLQTFVEHSRHSGSNWAKRFWIIVLFDPKALRKHWGEDQYENIEHPKDNLDLAVTTESIGTLQTNYITNLGEFSTFTSFTDKTFQIRFRVPPALLSNWHKKLLKFLGEAFTKHSQAEFHEVYRVYETYFSSLQTPPTIRKLKLFVNQIGVVHRQWVGKFPLSHIAYFTLFQNNIENHPNWFSNHPLIEYQSIFNDENALRCNFVAIAFNVELETAKELLLSSQIKKALTDGTNESVEELKELSGYGNGFWQVAEKLFYNETKWIEKEEEKISNAAFCLFESKLLETTTDNMAETTKSSLAAMSSNIKSSLVTLSSNIEWFPLDSQKAKGLVGIYNWTDDHEIQKRVLQNIIYGVSKANNLKKSIDISSFIDGLKFIKKSLPSGGSSNFYRESIVDGICRKLRTDRKDGPVTRDSQPYGEELKILLVTFFALGEEDPEVEELVLELCKEGIYLRYLNNVLLHDLNDANDYGQSSIDIPAWCLFLTLRFFPDALKNNQFSEMTEELNSLKQIYNLRLDIEDSAPISKQRFENIPQAFTNILIEYKSLWLFSKILEFEPDAKPFLGKCFAILINNKAAEEILTAKFWVDNWTFIKSSFAEESSADWAKIKKLITEKSIKITDILMKQEYNNQYIELYETLLPSNQKNTFHSWCQKGLNDTVLAEDWKTAIATQNHLFRIAKHLFSNDFDSQIGNHYLEALVLFFEEKISGVPDLVNNPLNTSIGLKSAAELITSEVDKQILRRRQWIIVLNSQEYINKDTYRFIISQLTSLVDFPEEGNFFKQVYLPNRNNKTGFEWIFKLLSSKLTNADSNRIAEAFNIGKQEYTPEEIQKIVDELLAFTDEESFESNYLKQIKNFREINLQGHLGA